MSKSINKIKKEYFQYLLDIYMKYHPAPMRLADSRVYGVLSAGVDTVWYDKSEKYYMNEALYGYEKIVEFLKSRSINIPVLNYQEYKKIEIRKERINDISKYDG